MNRLAALVAAWAIAIAAHPAHAEVAADSGQTERASGPGPRVTSAEALAPRLDLNAANHEQLVALGLPDAVAEAVIDRRTYVSWFTSAWDLLEVPGMTPELFAAIRDRVVVSPVFEAQRREMDEEERRAGELNALVQRLLSEEGASEGLVDSYVDQIREPRDVNSLDFSELVSIQNVSPVDAAAIVREREQAGRIENVSQLRATSGLSYWGYRNLRDYVTYAPREVDYGMPRIDAQLRVYNTPYTADDQDILVENIVNGSSGLTPEQAKAFRNYDLNTYAGRIGLGATSPALTQKLRARWGPHLRAGAASSRSLGEREWDATRRVFLSVENLPERDTRLGPLQLHRAVAGAYTVAFGLGVVMDATDFYAARRTGLGYSVRPVGLRTDLSRSDEFALNGLAVEAGLGRLRGTLFGSWDDKDAVLNPDGSFNRYIRMVPRVSNTVLDQIHDDIEAGVFAGRGQASAFLPMRDVMRERILGANLRWEFAPGTTLGGTAVDIRTRNRVFAGEAASRWNPDPLTLVIDPARIEDRDAEIGAAYDSRALGDYRRLWGADGQAVWRNLAFAGEYGKLETSTRAGAFRRLLDAGPEARVGQAYAQWENFNILALYRDYDLGYDDPYGRGFSEDTRYEQTILDGNAYRLQNPYWAMLARDLPEPKAERGWYLSMRWQPTRQLLVSGFEFDDWTRKADGADLSRVVGRLEYRPIFPLRLRLRHSISSRHADRPDDVRAYRSWDSRFEVLANLSNYDQLRFLYSTGNVAFAARGRLSGPAGGGDVQSDTTAQRGSPSQAFQAQFSHQFSNDVAVTFSGQVYDGFLWNYEDNEFLVVDGQGYRTWVMLRSRLSPNLSWRFKWTLDRARPRTYVDIRNFGSLVAPTPDGVNDIRETDTFRFQLDMAL